MFTHLLELTEIKRVPAKVRKFLHREERHVYAKTSEYFSYGLLDRMRGAFILLVGSITAASSLAASAQQPPMMEPSQAMTATVPQVKIVRAKRVEPAGPRLRSQLGDGEVNLMKGFPLGGPEGIGSGWKMPPMGDTFDTRYGRW